MSVLRNSQPEVENYVLQSAIRTGKSGNIFRTVSTSISQLCVGPGRLEYRRLFLLDNFSPWPPWSVVQTLALWSLRSLFLRLLILSSCVDSSRILWHAGPRSHASLGCCAIYQPFLPRTRCRRSCRSFRRFHLRLTVSNLSAESRRVRPGVVQTLSAVVSRFRGQNTLLLCLHVRRSGLCCQPDPPVLPTGSVVRISTTLPEGSFTSASVIASSDHSVLITP